MPTPSDEPNITPDELDGWRASAEHFALWWGNVEIDREMSGDDPISDDAPVLTSSIAGQNQVTLTAGHIREVIKLCRTK